MTKQRLHTARSVLTTILLSFIFVACTTIKPPKEVVSGYKHSNTVPLTIGLVLNDRLRKAKWDKKHTFIVPLGESLSKNSEALLRKLFTNVVTGKNKTDFNPGAVDLVVIPTMVSTEMTLPAWSFGKGTFTIFLEWKFLDKNRELVWVDTVQGYGEGNVWNTHGRVKGAIDNLFMNSHETISNAQEIRDLVKKSGN